ncbi:Polysaccharide deacetylase [Paraburkholderia fungorum]|uniref:Polysaccharide deacetylase n=1 Tax=Paraburkholderia fungorum TaxID=134537 RepID=A0A1H1HFS6_9BURK|nr:polysaccharide deacetylase family protein [Paraburkholderia fungorum]SDR24242.1 Polysaccharide deacetylase [Paraburkholderia fungorum]
MNSKILLRSAFTWFVLFTGLARGTRALLWKDRVAVLLYHAPEPAALDAHLQYLKKFSDIVSLAEIYSPGRGRPRAVITLDDGHANNARLLPIFIKHNVRPTIYLCSSIVAQPRTHWWMHPGAQTAGIERLKRMANRERLKELRARGFREDATATDTHITGLSVEQIEAMRPYVDFQSHTRFHPILTRCDDVECADELMGSKFEVETLSGRPCEHFSYPNGDYGQREIEGAKAAGYRTARTCDIGWNGPTSDPFRLKAFDIHDDSSVAWLAAQLTGIPQYLRYVLLGGGIRGRKPQL